MTAASAGVVPCLCHPEIIQYGSNCLRERASLQLVVDDAGGYCLLFIYEWNPMVPFFFCDSDSAPEIEGTLRNATQRNCID